MATGLNRRAVKSFKVEFSGESATAWGTYVLAERPACRPRCRTVGFTSRSIQPHPHSI